MFIQKVFHVHYNLAETKARLAKFSALNRPMLNVEKSVVTEDGVGQFAWSLPSGLRAHCVLVSLPTDDANQVLFQSTTGNVELAGLVEFIPVRDNLTEVQLSMEYGFRSFFHAAMDRFLRCMDRFFHRQIAMLKMQVEGGHASVAIS